MKRIILCLSLSVLCLTACVRENTNPEKGVEANGTIVLKERETPWEPNVSHAIAYDIATRAFQSLSHRDYLGYSLKDNIYPLEDTRNLGYKVIDVKKT